MCSFGSSPKISTPAPSAPPVGDTMKPAEIGGDTTGQTQKRKAKGKKALKIDSSSGTGGTGLNI